MQTNYSDFDRLVAGLSSKSDKIRSLARFGVPTADIARYLGIRYQFARNVIKDAGLPQTRRGVSTGPAGALKVDLPAQPGLPKAEWVVVGEGGRITLPAGLLAALGVNDGARVYVGPAGHGLEVLSRDGAKKRLDEIASKYRVPGVSVVDEFIAERRREAERD